MTDRSEIEVWDPLVRVFHWTLAASFATAYATEDDVLALHLIAGYTALALVAFRLVWGFVGPRHARFADFVRGPGEVLAYLKEIVAFRPRRYLGHNPAGGAMVIALLLLVALTGLSGLALYGAKEFAGPFGPLLAGVGEWGGDALEELHEFLAGFTLLLVVLHVAGVLLAGLQHRENLVRAMFTGRKAIHSEK